LSTDFYTKAVLTVIAVLLLIIVVQNYIQKPVIYNQPNLNLELGSQPLKVDIVKFNGSSVPIDLMDVYSFTKQGIPVRIID